MQGYMCLHLYIQEAERRKKIKFWNGVNECLTEIGRENRIVLIGDE